MKLRDDFLTQETDGEQVMVAAGGEGFSGMVRSNATAALIVDCLKSETTASAIVDAMCKKYDAPRTVIEADVAHILDTLRSIGAIEE